jgi:hypothetical protein
MNKEELIQFLKDNLSATVSVENDTSTNYYDDTTQFKVRVNLWLKVDDDRIIQMSTFCCVCKKRPAAYFPKKTLCNFGACSEVACVLQRMQEVDKEQNRWGAPIRKNKCEKLHRRQSSSQHVGSNRNVISCWEPRS